MKNIFLICILLGLLTSCKKLPINGDLDGMWHLMTIENNNGEIEDVKEEQIYYSIQLHLIYLLKINQPKEFLGRFIYTQDSLIIHEFRYKYNNAILANEEELKLFGLNSTTEKFSIEELTGKKMILRSEHSILSFRKF